MHSTSVSLHYILRGFTQTRRHAYPFPQHSTQQWVNGSTHFSCSAHTQIVAGTIMADRSKSKIILRKSTLRCKLREHIKLLLPDDVATIVSKLFSKHFGCLPCSHIISKPQHQLAKSFQGWKHLYR